MTIQRSDWGIDPIICIRIPSKVAPTVPSRAPTSSDGTIASTQPSAAVPSPAAGGECSPTFEEQLERYEDLQADWEDGWHDR